jgi:hypothetical protein
MTYLLNDSGERLSLQMPVPDDPAGTVLAAVEALWPVVQPLAVDLWLACADPGTPYLRPDAEPKQPSWHLREESPTVEVESRAGDAPQITVVPSLTLAALNHWVRQALNQPSSDCQVTFEKLSISFARARLPNDSALEDDDYFPLKDYTGVRRVPVERRHDGLWVTGPRPGLLLYPPLFYGFATEWGWLLANIWTTWSPIWTVPGSELESALRQMVAQGWQPYDLPSDFSL